MSTHTAPPGTDPGETVDASTPKRFRPHQLAIGLGIGIAVFTAASGIVPQITDWHNENDVHRVVFVNVPGPLQVMFYTLIPVLLAWGAFRFADRMKNWERGGPAPTRRTTAEERQAPLRRLPRRRVHAHAVARSSRRRDALDDLLRVPGPARGHDRARGRPPTPRGPQVPPRPHLPGLRVRRRRGRRRVRRRHRVGDRASLRATAVPDPHQDQGRTRVDPRHVPRHRAHRLRCRDVPHRPRGNARLRGVELHRLPAEPTRRRRVGRDPAGLASGLVGRPRRCRSSPSS